MNVQSPLWRRALRRSRRWWSGQTRSRRIPLMAGGFGLLGAIACCCLALPAALTWLDEGHKRRKEAKAAARRAETKPAAGE